VRIRIYETCYRPWSKRSNSALLTDALGSRLRRAHSAAKRGR
jgi:hypothetical protein